MQFLARSLTDSRSSRDMNGHSRKCGIDTAFGRQQLGQGTSAVGSEAAYSDTQAV